jgi:DNA-binding response OmpR family regulator
MDMRLLIVEDDALLGGGLCAALGKSGFKVTWVRDGVAALDLLQTQEFAALVLDIGLPGMNGFEVLRKVRQHGPSMPVLILSARDATGDKVQGFEGGADDYVVKTADLEELIARLRALIRRSGHGLGVLRVGELVLNLDTRGVTHRGISVSVSRREFDLLRIMMEATGRVLTRSQLEQSLYGWTRSVDSNAVEVHIHNLRNKLGSTAFKTVRGVGYMLARPEA